MSLIPQQQYGPTRGGPGPGPYGQQQQMMPGQGRLPFQQINPGAGYRGNTDQLLEQRMMERNNMDMMHGGRPMHPQQQQQQMIPQMMQSMPMQPVAGSVNIHPAIISQFLQMPPQAQQRLAQMQPQYYQQIMNTIARQQQGGRAPPPPGDDTNSTLSTSSIETPNSDESSDLENSHSSEEGSDHELKLDTKKSKSKSKSKPKSSSKSKSKSSSKSKSKRDRRSHVNAGIRPRERTLRVKPTHTRTTQNVTRAGADQGQLFLSLDFRNDLVEINNDSYVLGFPMQHHVTGIELESCLINRNPILEREPYIYMLIEELEGDYQVNSGHRSTYVFGKLIQEKTVNEFIVYKPENCVKFMDRPKRLDRLSITFLRYDMTPIALNRMSVEKLGRARHYIKVTTKSPHNLSVGDHVNISQTNGDQVCVDMVEVVKVLRPDLVALENPVNSIERGSSLQFEKVDLKCTMTFRLVAKK